MPIKGISEQRRIMRGGHIRLGIKAKTKDGKEYPKKIDYFLADFEDKEVEKLYYKLYGEQPKKITISFAGEDPEQIFPQWYKCYGKSTGIKCKGNGETADRIVDGQWVEVECPGPADCDFAHANGMAGKPGCKRLGQLQFFIKGLPGLQVFQINTTGYYSIVNINSGIDLLARLRGGKPIFGVWVDLVIFPQVVQVEGKNQTIYAMKIVFNVDLDNVKKLTSVLETPIALPSPVEEKDGLLYPDEQGPEIIEWERDDDVVIALRQAGLFVKDMKYLFQRATQENWPKARMMAAIEKMSATKDPEPEPEDVEAVPVEAETEGYDDGMPFDVDDDFGMPMDEPEPPPPARTRRPAPAPTRRARGGDVEL